MYQVVHCWDMQDEVRVVTNHSSLLLAMLVGLLPTLEHKCTHVYSVCWHAVLLGFQALNCHVHTAGPAMLSVVPSASPDQKLTRHMTALALILLLHGQVS